MPEQLWKPTMAEMVAGYLAVLCDERAFTDALFIHSSQGDPELDTMELCEAFYYYTKNYNTRKKIVLNGLTAKQCQELNLAYCGYEKWREYFLSFGIKKGAILLLPPSKHTGAESENLLHLAKEKGWKSMIIMAYPYHLLRCMCQIVAAMEKLQIHLKVYAKTFRFREIDWQRKMTRIVMNGANVLGQGTVDGQMMKHIASELERVEKYAQEGGNFTRHATIPELLKYLAERDK